MTGGCTALMTQNNEVLVLDCPDQSQKPIQKNCFYLHTPDNQIHTVCQKKVEERCIGVVTPSNLTVLFECFFCSESMEYVYYNYERQKKFRWFVKSYLENEYIGKNSALLNLKYEVFNNNLDSSSSLDTYSYWVPKTSCLGITLESNETILLECMVLKEKQEQPGCFQLITAENEKQSVCTEILNEACVGLTTPKNLSVALACYNTVENYRTDVNRPEWLFILHTLKDFVNNRYAFHIGDYFDAFRETENNKRETKKYQVRKLKDQPNCTGILTETEKIVLSCTEGKIEQNGCFNVTNLGQESNNEVLDKEEKVESVCVKVLNSQCVGVITPDNWILPYSCAPPVAYVSRGGAAVVTSGYISNSIPPKLPIRLRRS
ncbi:uncharacterized protein LOC111691405 isoform X1 [Anoplophora glabripennis]|uniref:uncharacterized protein LOC111691405 isoform X1 n=1 Tax=Anoplophora glabripennis TaxID=217634 RepID=UPI000C7853E3|nr:uncharacterized protein LOC111691405 isoform X1 [Anoplophora glabripennis]